MEREPPHSEKAERALIGAVLLGDECFRTCPEDMADLFWEPRYAAIWRVLVDLGVHAKPLDLILVSDELKRRNLLNLVGGQEFLVELAESCPENPQPDVYVYLIRRDAALRRLIHMSGELVHGAFDGELPPKVVEEMIVMLKNWLAEPKSTQKNVPFD